MSVLARKLMNAAAGGPPYAFNITVGDYSGVYFGYFPALEFGSIDVEPIPGESLVYFFWVTASGTPQVAFGGDILSLVTDLDLWFEGVQIAEAGDWYYDEEDIATKIECFDSVDVTSGTYLVELIAP